MVAELEEVVRQRQCPSRDEHLGSQAGGKWIVGSEEGARDDGRVRGSTEHWVWTMDSAA